MTRIDVPAGWTPSEDGKRMRLEVETKDFAQAIDVVREVASLAEEMDHHPDLHVESYNRLRIETTSHDVGGLTQRDARLAGAIGAILEAHGLRP